jgi:hypothetical protein
MIRQLFTYILLLGFSLAHSQNDLLTDSNLPIFIINTDGATIPNEPKVTAHLGIVDNGAGVRNSLNDDFNGYDGQIGIEIRGNGTANLDKHSYLFETRNADGSNNNVELLGMPSENDWILYAPYIDKSLIRNVMTYDLAKDMGLLASRTRYCEVVINGEYLGVFVLMEKIKRDKNRVPVAKFQEDDPSPENGGYIVRIDSWWNESLGWVSDTYYVNGEDRTINYQYVYPKHDDITDPQKEYIEKVITDFENDLNEAPINSSEIYLKHIDLNSFVDYLILNEFGKNPDAYRLSTYLYFDPTDENPKITMGPVWDHNHCYGSYAVYENKWTKWDFDNHWWDYHGQIPFWWERFMQDPLFAQTFSDRYKMYRGNLLDCELLSENIDAYAEEVQEAQERNFTRWPILGENEPFDWNSGPTYMSELDYLKNWICKRLEWMDTAIGRIDRSFIDGNFEVIPNPNRGNFDLSFRLDSGGTRMITVYNLDGQRIHNQYFHGFAGANSVSVQLDNATVGTYIVHLVSEEEVLTTKVQVIY